jgi:hypothetical protein
LARVDCLDRLAPSEAALILDRNGELRAATRTAYAVIGPPYPRIGEDISRKFELFDRPTFLDALADCHATHRPIEIALRIQGERGTAGRRIAAILAFDRAGMISMRLRKAQTNLVPQVTTDEDGGHEPNEPAALDPCMGSKCDMQEAIAFALRRTGPRAQRLGVAVIVDAEAQLTVACDRQMCRRALKLLMDYAVTMSRFGGAVSISARQRRGVVLLRITTDAAMDAENGTRCLRGPELSAAGALVEQAGGTMLIERSAEGLSLSVRLDLVPA